MSASLTLEKFFIELYYTITVALIVRVFYSLSAWISRKVACFIIWDAIVLNSFLQWRIRTRSDYFK